MNWPEDYHRARAEYLRSYARWKVALRNLDRAFFLAFTLFVLTLAGIVALALWGTPHH